MTTPPQNPYPPSGDSGEPDPSAPPTPPPAPPAEQGQWAQSPPPPGQPSQPQQPGYGEQPQQPSYGQQQVPPGQPQNPWAQTPQGQQQGQWAGPPPQGDGSQGYGAPGAFGAGVPLQTSPPRNGRTKWILGGIAAVLVVGLVGAVAFAAPRLLAGSAQPEDRVPASVIAFAKVDLDPSAGQKLGAVRFAGRFADIKDSFKEDGDLREGLWQQATKSDSSLGGFDYAKDIKPWLGKRAAGAFVSGLPGEDPQGIVLLQVTDEDKAKDGITKILQADSEQKDPAFVISEGYAFFGETQAIVDKFIADAKNAPLSEDANFQADSKRLGEDGITSGWVDLSRLRDVVKSQLSGANLPQAQVKAAEDVLQGRLSWGARFDGNDPELVFKGVGFTNYGTNGQVTNKIGELPRDTLAAISLTNYDDQIKKVWPKLLEGIEASDPSARSKLDELAGKAGIALPDDLAVLFGYSLTVALGSQTLTTSPQIGARIDTDADRFLGVAYKLLGSYKELTASALGGFGTSPGAPTPQEVAPVLTDLVKVERYDGGLAISNTPDYAAKLAQRGDLGETDQFKKALPDIADADFAAFVDIDGLVTAAGSEAGLDQKTRDSLNSLDSAGYTLGVDDEGIISMRIKVVTK